MSEIYKSSAHHHQFNLIKFLCQIMFVRKCVEFKVKNKSYLCLEVLLPLSSSTDAEDRLRLITSASIVVK